MMASFYQDHLTRMGDERLQIEHDNIREAINYATTHPSLTDRLEALYWKLDDIMREERRRKVK